MESPNRKTIEVEWEPETDWLPWQKRVVAQSKRFNVPAKGRRCGGTSLCEDLAIDMALDGYPVGWVSASYKILAEAEREIVDALRPVLRCYNRSERRYELHGGGVVDFWSAEGNISARGRKYKRLVVDEGAHIPGLMELWERELRATLMDLKGDAWFPSSPNGMNDYRILWEKGQDAKKSNWASWQIPSWENPLLDRQEIEDAKHDLSESSFRQEWGAEFVTRAGAVFPMFSRSRHVRHIEVDPELPIYIGVDFGFLTWAIVLFQIKSNTVEIIGEGQWHEVTSPAAVANMIGQPYGNGKPFNERVSIIGCDPESKGRNRQTGMPDINLLRGAFPHASVRYSSRIDHKNPNWRADRIRDLLLSMAGDVRLYVADHCVNTIRMFENSVYPEHKEGHEQKEDPVKDGVVDHIRDALGYGLVNANLFGAPARGVMVEGL